ncbi:hypothetical protein GCM10027072_70730 [Streptomyces bullii]
MTPRKSLTGDTAGSAAGAAEAGAVSAPPNAVAQASNTPRCAVPRCFFGDTMSLSDRCVRTRRCERPGARLPADGGTVGHRPEQRAASAQLRAVSLRVDPATSRGKARRDWRLSAT